MDYLVTVSQATGLTSNLYCTGLASKDRGLPLPKTPVLIAALCFGYLACPNPEANSPKRQEKPEPRTLSAEANQQNQS